MKKLLTTLMIVLLAGLAAQAATYYGFKIGGVAVNSDNYNNVTGSTISGSVSYNPSTNTVTLTNVTISRTGDYNRCIYNESNDGLIVNLVGTNNLSARDAAAVRLDSGTSMRMVVKSGTTTLSSVNEEAVYVNSNSNYFLRLMTEGTGKMVLNSTNKAAVASGNTAILYLKGAIDAYGKKGAIDWEHQVVVWDDGYTGVTLRSTGNSSYPVFQAKTLTLDNNTQILQPAGAVWNSSQGTITLDGSAVYNRDILIGRDCAVLINSTNFPDVNFRNYLLSLYPKGYLNSTDIANLTTLNVNNKNISNLKGVELFTSLENLICYSNNLSWLNVSGFTKLQYLDCANNPALTSLNVTNCTSLKELYCYITALTSLNVTSCTALVTLNCRNTNITELRVTSMPHLISLDVSNCTSLLRLYCYNNSYMIRLNVTGCTALLSLSCYQNPNFTTFIGLADCTALNNLYCYDCALTSLDDVQSLPNLALLSCMNNRLTSLTLYNKSNLTDLYCQDNPLLTTLTVYSNPALTTLNCSYCTALTNLNCRSNDLTSLNITGCTALKELRCYYNSHLQTILGLGGCTALTYVDCEDCAITNLGGLQNANNIATIYARNNQLTSFAVSGKSNLTYLRVSGNPSLTTLHCYTNALTTLVVTGCTSLANLSCYENPGLTSITGLADCSNLTTVYAYSCAFASLNFSNMTKLAKLDCSSNQLTSLNLTGCTALTNLLCPENTNLTTITGLADCKAITTLNCNSCAITNLSPVNTMTGITLLSATNNQLTSLVVTGKSNLKTLLVQNNPMLTSLQCYYNNLTNLNVSGCTALSDLRCYNNDNLTYIGGLGSCSELTYFDCEDCAINTLNGIQNKIKLQTLLARNNRLTQLDVTGCVALTRLNCYKNQITGSNMTFLVNSLPQRTASNPGYLHVIFNTDEGNTMTTDQIATARSKYWIPRQYDGSVWFDLTAVQHGDVDGSGQINMDDLTILINYLLTGDASLINPIGADVDGNGPINMDDLTALINYLLTH